MPKQTKVKTKELKPVDHKFIAWSFHPEERQTFCDLVMAQSAKEAQKIMERVRPYAVQDLYVMPMRLSEYVKNLLDTREADMFNRRSTQKDGE